MISKQTAKLVARIAENLPAEMSDEIMQGWIDNPKGLQKFLSGLVLASANGRQEFPVYLELEVGGKSKDELIAEIESAGMFVSDLSKDIMSKPAWKPGEKETVKFARVSVRDLGFTKNPTTTQIWARIRELGHSLCESGDGPALRRALKGQVKGDICWTAMEQITDSDGDPHVFELECYDDGEQWLPATWASPGDSWDLGYEIVFRLSK